MGISRVERKGPPASAAFFCRHVRSSTGLSSSVLPFVEEITPVQRQYTHRSAAPVSVYVASRGQLFTHGHICSGADLRAGCPRNTRRDGCGSSFQATTRRAFFLRPLCVLSNQTTAMGRSKQMIVRKAAATSCQRHIARVCPGVDLISGQTRSRSLHRNSMIPTSWTN